MPVSPDQFATAIERKGLPAACLVFGDEPLQAQESVDKLRAAARADGVGERVVFDVDRGFDWNDVRAGASEMSLFAERRLIEIRLGSRKPDKSGSEVLIGLCDSEGGADIILVTADALDRKAQGAKWFKAIEHAGIAVQCRQIAPAELERWILRRAARRELNLTPAAAELIAVRAEGNCLAIAQEIDKLRLLVDDGECDVDTVMNAMADSARFSVFGLVDAIVGGAPVKAIRMLRGLREEGTEPVFIGWALNRELRVLVQVSAAIASGKPVQSALNEHKVWSTRARITGRALERHTTGALTALFRQSIRLDRIVKGTLPGDPWDELELLCLGLASGGRPDTRGRQV